MPTSNQHSENLSGDSVTLGIRPEDIHVGENGNNQVSEHRWNWLSHWEVMRSCTFGQRSTVSLHNLTLLDVPQHNALVTVQLQHGQGAPIPSRDRRIVDRGNIAR